MSAVPSTAKSVYKNAYPEADAYKGKNVSECTAKCTINAPDQFFSSTWYTGRIASDFKNGVEAQGAVALDIEIFEDTSPTWVTDYYVVAHSYIPDPAAGTIAAVQAIVIWAAVFVALLVALVVSTIFLIREVKTISFASPVGSALLLGGIGLVLIGGAMLVGSLKGGTNATKKT